MFLERGGKGIFFELARSEKNDEKRVFFQCKMGFLLDLTIGRKK